MAFDRNFIFNKYGGKCAYCGSKLIFNTFHVDHIEPKFRKSTHSEVESYGRKKGKDIDQNGNPSCKSCNSSKSTFTIEQWRWQIKNKVNVLRRDSSTFRILERYGLLKVSDSDVIFYFEING